MPASEEENDESLVRRLKQSDHQAFSILVRRHSDMFYRAAFRVVMNKEEAEDAVQNSFLKLWDRPEIWKDGKGATFKTWFYSIVINQCRDQLRRKKNNVGGDYIETMIDEAELSDMSMIEKQNQEYMSEAIQMLPEKQMLALNLCFYEGLTNKEAAKIIGVKVKALESLLMRAKASVKNTLISQGVIEQEESA